MRPGADRAAQASPIFLPSFNAHVLFVLLQLGESSSGACDKISADDRHSPELVCFFVNFLHFFPSFCREQKDGQKSRPNTSVLRKGGPYPPPNQGNGLYLPSQSRDVSLKIEISGLKRCASTP